MNHDDYIGYPETPGFVAGCDTSQAAALSIMAGLGEIQTVVLRKFDQPRTCDEVEVLTGLKHQTVSARIRELVIMKAIEDTGDRRMTRSGRTARVYAIRLAAAA